MDLQRKTNLRQKRIWRIRKKVSGTAERPRLCLHLSCHHLYAQAIDDMAGHTQLFVSSLGKDIKAEKIRPNKAGATRLGSLFAEKAKALGIAKVVFDRNGRRYHGVVKAFAEAARKGGLDF